MFKFDTSDIQRITVSAIGALIVSTACITAAVGPVHAATPISADGWQRVVERSIDDTLRAPAHTAGKAVATVRLAFDADGGFTGATLARSSGNASYDAEALRTASRIAYPALPAGFRGKPQTVAMKIGFETDPRSPRKPAATLYAAR